MLVLVLAACFTEDPEDSADSTPEACEERTPEACESDDTCAAIRGELLAIEETCYEAGERVAVGCMPADWGCGEAMTYAPDPTDGTCWQFRNTCLPEGWGPGGGTPADGCPGVDVTDECG